MERAPKKGQKKDETQSNPGQIQSNSVKSQSNHSQTRTLDAFTPPVHIAKKDSNRKNSNCRCFYPPPVHIAKKDSNRKNYIEKKAKSNWLEPTTPRRRRRRRRRRARLYSQYRIPNIEFPISNSQYECVRPDGVSDFSRTGPIRLWIPIPSTTSSH